MQPFPFLFMQQMVITKPLPSRKQENAHTCVLLN